MFATHYPIDNLLWGIQALVSAMRASLAELAPAERADFFGGTARRVYGLRADLSAH
jgi:predicted TIM-barrel fold metal-dependent hydrolase